LDDEHAKQVIILSNYDELIRTAIVKRSELEMLPSNDAAQIAAKEALLSGAEERLEQLKLAADLLIAAELTEHKDRRKEMARAAAHMKATQYVRKPLAEFRRFASEQLGGHRTFHWPLEFPEVIERGGFDAFVGNPPFLGGKKITGLLGTDYRDYLVTSIAAGKLGVADLCAFFFLRASSMLRADSGMFGLLATNTIAQGDTREVGLEQLCTQGCILQRAVKSAPWPGDAALEVSHVWLRRGPWRGDFVLDQESVTGITAFLDSSSASTGTPFRLAANAGKSFQGTVILGLGFVISLEEAEALIAKDNRNHEVIFPFLNGDDVNSRPDQTPSRWIINFFDWPLERSAEGRWANGSESDHVSWLRSGRVPADYPHPVAADYPLCLQVVRQRVKPERDLVKRDAYRMRWWNYAERQRSLYEGLTQLRNCLVTAQTSKYTSVSIQPTTLVFSQALIVLLFDDALHLLALTSTIHALWVLQYASSLETRLRYVPTDCLENFPFPEAKANWSIAETYHTLRCKLMIERQEGLTKIYNRFHDPGEKSADITRMRDVHVQLDQALAAAYGWSDLDLGHGFHETKQGVRYTLSDSARRTVLNRLLALNHQRYEEEDKAGLHDKKVKGSGKRASGKSKPEKSTAQGALY
jgi:hypothetical protein